MLPPAADGAPMLRADAKAAAVRATAAEIARLLRESAQERIRLDDVPLRSADIAVLVRTHAQGVDVKDALAALGVGSVELAQESIFRTPDAGEVARVLAAVLEPSRANLVRSALATQILGQGAAAIAALTDDDAAFSAHVDRFVEYRLLWRTRGFAVMYRRLIAAEGVVARMLARSDGERRMTNLLHLGEQLQEAAASGMAPDALLRWLATERNERARDDARELRLESDRNLVHIVTIHKAKGLEYPFVFCPFFFEGGYWQPRTDVREYHDDGDAVLDFTPTDKGNPDSVAIDARILAEVAAERVRLLYVALTRAAQRCYLVAGVYAMVQGRSTKESARALGNWLVAGDGMDLVAWLANGRSPDDIAAAWRRLAERAAPDIAIVPLPLDRGAPFVEAATDPAAIVARTPPARIRAEWRIGSFSALAQGATSDGAAADHDARAVEPDATAAASSAQADDIVRFPRGAAAGECLHAIFERIDFGDSGGWPTIVADALAQFPPARAAADGARLAPMVERMLRDVVATPLPIGGTLATVTRERRLVELGFTFPASTPDTARLRDAVAAAGYATPRLAPGSLLGYLNGYVDLVFEHAGRYYVLDWKSNHLGNTAADYASAALARTMRDHGYHLQQLIYAVALDRYLRRRITRYDHDHAFRRRALSVRARRAARLARDRRRADRRIFRPPERGDARAHRRRTSRAGGGERIAWTTRQWNGHCPSTRLRRRSPSASRAGRTTATRRSLRRMRRAAPPMRCRWPCRRGTPACRSPGSRATATSRPCARGSRIRASSARPPTHSRFRSWSTPRAGCISHATSITKRGSRAPSRTASKHPRAACRPRHPRCWRRSSAATARRDRSLRRRSRCCATLRS